MPYQDEVLDRIDQLLRDVNHSSTSIHKYRYFRRYLSEVLSLPMQDIYVAYVNEVKNFTVRIEQSPGARRSKLRVCLVPYDVTFRYFCDAARKSAKFRFPGI